MPGVVEFRQAKLTLGDDDLPYVVEAKIQENWESISFPVYLDRSDVRTLPTVKNIVAHIKRRYEEEGPLHSALDGSPVVLSFDSGTETHEYSQARVLEWKVYGKLGGDLMEEVAIACEGVA